MAAEPRRAPIGIIGGGPVGMMLALFLERHGVPAVLFNIEDHSRWHPKGSTHGSRSMEHYRRLGFSTQIRHLGLPLDHPTDCAYFTRFAGYEIARIGMPSEAERMARVQAAPRTDQVPEPIHRANQMYVEKFLFDRIATCRTVERRYGWRVTDVRADSDGVSVVAEPASGGAPEEWRFQYLIGCDGGQSIVRRTLGIRYSGFDALQQEFWSGRMISTYLRLPTFLRDIVGARRRAWQYTGIVERRRLVLVTLDGKDEFMLFTRAPDPNVAPDDAAIRRHVQDAVGVPIPVDVLSHNPWTAGVALVAERFGEGRLLLAGDSVHLFTPTGGFGMNTGIDDAANLSWKLAAMVQGWGGPNLLASYEPERRPIAIRNTTAARTLAQGIGNMPAVPELDEASPAGEASRKRLGAFIESSLGEEFASIGVQLGARYDGSAITCEDGAPPSFDPVVYQPSSVPGGRAPHLWLGAGRAVGQSLYDNLGIGFALLCFGKKDGTALAAAAARRNVPLTVLDLAGDGEARDIYERDFALIRPDQHVCWRGNALPDDCGALLARVTGH